MNTVNVHLIFSGNYVISHQTYFKKHKYLTQITRVLIICKLIIPSKTVIAKPLAKPLFSKWWCLLMVPCDG